MLSYYKSSQAVLFPSKIETFGLPLIEAATFGLPVIASDLPFSREVLENYDNKYFCSSQDYKAWAKAIENILENAKLSANKLTRNGNSWNEFMHIIKELI